MRALGVKSTFLVSLMQEGDEESREENSQESKGHTHHGGYGRSTEATHIMVVMEISRGTWHTELTKTWIDPAKDTGYAELTSTWH